MFGIDPSGVDAALDRVGLAGVAGERVRGYSQGMRQRVAVARALLRSAELVLLDEPCAGVNPILVDELHDLLVNLNRTQGGSFVVIEHNMDFIMKLCAHVVCMVEGKVLAEGPPAEVQSNRQVLEAYLGN